MAKALQITNTEHIPSIFHEPRAYLTIDCVCGKQHQIDLTKLPASTNRRVQVKQECNRARHFIVHNGHPRYRKILLISEFGDNLFG